MQHSRKGSRNRKKSASGVDTGEKHHQNQPTKKTQEVKKNTQKKTKKT